jgi:hypothetical protein
VGKGASPRRARGWLSSSRRPTASRSRKKDLEARGPGDLLGRRQSGLPALRVADPLHDLGRLAQARGEVLAMRAEGKKVESDLFGFP